MTHDPLCPLRAPQYEAEWCHDCRVIAETRADEREKAAQRIENLGCGLQCGCSIGSLAIAAVRGES